MFRYVADPLCLVCCLAYAANRFLLKPHVHSGFFHGYFNDLLLIPCALPVVLWVQRRLGLRQHDRMPEFPEILFHLVVWSILFEGIGPFLFHHTTGDPWDVVVYFIGGCLGWFWWNARGIHQGERLAS
jgi:hypothetical protein